MILARKHGTALPLAPFHNTTFTSRAVTLQRRAHPALTPTTLQTDIQTPASYVANSLHNSCVASLMASLGQPLRSGRLLVFTQLPTWLSFHDGFHLSDAFPLSYLPNHLHNLPNLSHLNIQRYVGESSSRPKEIRSVYTTTPTYGDILQLPKIPVFLCIHRTWSRSVVPHCLLNCAPFAFSYCWRSVCRAHSFGILVPYACPSFATYYTNFSTVQPLLLATETSFIPILHAAILNDRPQLSLSSLLGLSSPFTIYVKIG